MRHRKGGFKLQRDPSARKALLRGLVTSVIMHERIETTVTKAKAVRPRVERVITLAKRDTLHARRQAAAYLYEPAAVVKLFDSIGPRFADRVGGYTRIVRLGPRQGDGAETAILELLGSELKKKSEDKRKRREDRMQAADDSADQPAGQSADQPRRALALTGGSSPEADGEGAEPPEADEAVTRSGADEKT